MFKDRQGRVGPGAPITYHAHTRGRARREDPELVTLSDPPTLFDLPAPRSPSREGRGVGVVQILKLPTFGHRWEFRFYQLHNFLGRIRAKQKHRTMILWPCSRVPALRR